MKRLFFILAFGSVMLGVQAQEVKNEAAEYHHEFYASGGLLNDNQLFSMVGDVLGAVFTLGQAVKPHKYWVLTPSIGYRYWFNKRIGIGVHFAFDKNSVEAIHRDTIRHEWEWRVHNRYFYTVAMDVNWSYMCKPICQLYGNAGMGVTLVQFSDNKATDPDARLKQFPFFNMHISPFGVRVGRDIAGFAEFGWGYKGFINAGLSVKF